MAKKPTPKPDAKPKKKSAAKPKPPAAKKPIPKPKPAPKPSENYSTFKERQAEISRERSATGREIGPLPKVKHPKRRAKCAKSLQMHCETYHKARFPLAWGEDHLAFIGDLQRIIFEGGQQAEALPRGTGKTTLCEVGAEWATINGYRRFVELLGSTEGAAELLLENIKAGIETNDLLAEDYPEVCYPIRCLQGINNRANGQTLEGERTRIEWTQKSIVLPTIKGKRCSGATIQVAGLTGNIRGAARVVEGAKVRPDLVIVDDPQTDESARSPSQNMTREAILAGAVLGLAGPGKKIAAVMPCTVIRPDDMADRILDRARHPEWHGRRCKLLRKMPDRLDLWDRYGELLRDGLRRDPPDRLVANQFYVSNRLEMDREAEASWAVRFNPDQLSAVQYAMDLYLLDPKTFFAEYQNEPVADEQGGGAEPIDANEAATKLNRIARGIVPVECTRLTLGIDVHQELLFWCVVGWDEFFGGSVVDYGTFPQQPVSRFNAADPSPSLSSVYAGAMLGLEARIFKGLEVIAREVILREWQHASGGPALRIDRALVDAGWGEQVDTVHQWARQSVAASVINASKGMYVGAAKTPFGDWKPMPGERHGLGWRVKASPTARGRLCLLDTNYWKSFLAERIRSATGTPGAMHLFGSSPAAHSLFCDHLAAEHPVRVNANGRTVDEWQSNPGHPDNHWLDCVVMAAGAAAVGGLRFHPTGDRPPKKIKKRIDIEELYARAQS